MSSYIYVCVKPKKQTFCVSEPNMFKNVNNVYAYYECIYNSCVMNHIQKVTYARVRDSTHLCVPQPLLHQFCF